MEKTNRSIVSGSCILYYSIPTAMIKQTKSWLDLMEARSVPIFPEEWKNQEDSPLYDAVDKPEHYMLFGGEKETIDLLRDRLSHEELKGYLKGNMIKYLMRAGKKSDAEFEDICKIGKYVEMYKEEFTNG